MSCKAIREGDELSCAACGVRWPVDDPDWASCRGAIQPIEVAPAQIDVLAATTKLAQAAIGPYDDRWVGREKLLALRRHKWSNMADDSQRRGAFVSVKAVLAELRLMPREEVLALLDSKD